MVIRQETQQDYAEVYRLIAQAFETAAHADGNEQDLVTELRKGEAFIKELSLVAEVDGELAGHILFTKARVGEDTVLALAPLSVKPEFQRRGIGLALMERGHEIAEKLGYQYSLVLGSEQYYPKAGYLPAEEFGVEVPDGVPAANFMVKKLCGNAKPISGRVVYAREFGM